MRSSILTIVFLCLISSLSIAQTGIKLGVNMSKLTNSYLGSSKLSYLPGFQVGFWHRRPINAKLGICAEAAFTATGGYYTTANTGQKIPNRYFFANVPLLLTYQVHKSLALEAGGNADVFLPIYRNNLFKAFSAGAVAGMYLRLGPKLSASLRYQHPITALDDSYNNSRIRSVQLSLHFNLYPLKDNQQ